MAAVKRMRVVAAITTKVVRRKRPGKYLRASRKVLGRLSSHSLRAFFLSLSSRFFLPTGKVY